MKNVFLTTVLAVSVFLPLACGDGVIAGKQIVGGNPSGIIGGTFYGGLPAVGAILYDGEQHCTGTLVERRKVLTAGHCVAGYSASRMSFAIGPRVDDPEAVIDVASAQAHPDFDRDILWNDIGVIILAEDAPVDPMGVVTEMDDSWVGRELFFVGYGASNGISLFGYGIKRAVRMKVKDISWSKFYYGGGGKNTCFGDSGGPAFYEDQTGRNLIAGVTSSGDAECAVIGTDTRVDRYLDFLALDDVGPEPDPCHGESAAGRCDGDNLVWCENNKIRRLDCAAEDKECQLDGDSERYACIRPQPADPCAGETYEGRCDGDLLIWCEENEIHRLDCTADGRRCALNAKNYPDCLAVEPADPCAGETYGGRCDGDLLIWCEENEIHRADCAADGERCALIAEDNFDCLAVEPEYP